MDWRGRGTRVAVVGGAGFLGLHLVRHLTNGGARVRAVDIRTDRPAGMPPAADYVGGCDVSNTPKLRAAIRGCSAVVNLVGVISYWRRDRERLWAVNCEGAAAVARACADEGVERFVHVSSSAALGFRNDPGDPIDEDFRFDWKSPLAKHYMVSKRAGDEATALAIDRGVSTAIAHPAAMYGPGDTTNTARLFTAVRRGRVRVVPPGGNAVVDVRDVAVGIGLLLASEGRSDRYLFVGQNLTFREIVEEVGRAVGRPARPARLPRWSRQPLCASLRVLEPLWAREKMVAPDDLELGFMHRYASSRRAEGALGWKPSFTFGETVADQARDLRERGLL
jgi:nucleoside-diphosphate-sugar epimerase